MAAVSARYLELAAKSKGELNAIFEAGTAPEITALVGFEFRGYNQPKAAAMLGLRKFIKAFYRDDSGQPFGCNTPVIQNGLDDEWIARPHPDQPKRYAFFQVEGEDQDSPDRMRRNAVLLDYAQGRNPPYQVARILRDYLVRVEPGSDDLLLGKAFFVIGRRPLANSFFLAERYRPLADASALAQR